MSKINLKFKGERVSEILIGDENPADLLHNELKKENYSQVVIFCDEQVAELYGQRIEQNISSKVKAVRTEMLTFPAGEQAKSWGIFSQLLEEVTDKKYPKDSLFIALGGGVTGDLAGFIASIYMRGVDLWQVPTTLLAMVDSSIGGKNGINSQHAKNIVGTFYQPRKILVAPKFLESLPAEQLREGMAELIKTLILFDRKAFTGLEGSPIDLKNPDWLKLTNLIGVCATAKGKIVEADEREVTGQRSLLNFGHTVAHALEKASEHQISHGEAVATGMIVESNISHLAGEMSDKEAKRIEKMILQYGFTKDVDFAPEKLYNIIKLDKKNKSGKVCLPLIKAIGKVAEDKDDWIYDFAEDKFLRLLKQSINK